jgi:hypothetical protein
MKALLRPALFLLAVVFARADLIVEQKLDSPFMNGNITMKIKGDQARMDLPNPAGGNVTMLINIKSGEMTTLIHAQKVLMKMKLEDAKKQGEEQQKAAGVDVSKIEKPKATGMKEKVGDWDCEIFEMNTGGVNGRVWVAKDFPNFKAVMDQMNKFSSALSGTIDPSKFDLGGMQVKAEVTVVGAKVTTTVVKVKEEPVADSEFSLPDGYEEKKLPL